MYCLLSLVPIPFVGAVHLVSFERRKDLWPFVTGLLSAMYDAGACQCCCSMSKGGLIKNLRT